MQPARSSARGSGARAALVGQPQSSWHIGPLELDVHEVAPGEYYAYGEVPVPGQWQLELSVRVTDFDLAEATFAAPVD